MMSDLNMSHKNNWICFIYIIGFTLLIKLRKFDFESHWKTLIVFDQKNDVRFENVLPDIVWFGLSSVVWTQFRQKVEKYEF